MSRTPPPTPSSPIIDAAVRSALPSGPRPLQPLRGATGAWDRVGAHSLRARPIALMVG
jgi:hypothetical protein